MVFLYPILFYSFMQFMIRLYCPPQRRVFIYAYQALKKQLANIDE